MVKTTNQDIYDDLMVINVMRLKVTYWLGFHR